MIFLKILFQHLPGGAVESHRELQSNKWYFFIVNLFCMSVSSLMVGDTRIKMHYDCLIYMLKL